VRILLTVGCLAWCLCAQQRLIRPARPEIIPPEVLRTVDAIEADPAHVSVEFENERTRVLRVTLKANESIPMHDDQEALLVCLKECNLRLTRANGHRDDIHMEAGRTKWLYADTRSERNLGSQTLEMLIVETKPTAR
jgi:hypothetical protein